jgi:hypothetical protein
MQRCSVCHTLYADVQPACPHCGRKPGDPEGEVVASYDRSLEEGFGRGRRRQLSAIIVGLLLGLIGMGLLWALR